MFSFLSAGIMSAINYGRLGYVQKKRKDIFSIVLVFIVYLALTNILDEKVASGLVLIAINIVMALYYKTKQEKIYKEYMENYHKKSSLKIPILLSIVFALTLLGIGYGTDYLYLKITGRYEGDIYNGIGKMYDKNGNIQYEGYFKYGTPNGKGKLYHENESLSYDGNFRYGKFDGKGKVYYKNSNLAYEGDFKDNLQHG